jgi:hypothetical protein
MVKIALCFAYVLTIFEKASKMVWS